MAVVPVRGAPADPWPFVGRADEVADALAHLGPVGPDPDGGRRPVGVLVDGVAGIGKSRLLDEIAFRVRDARRVVVELRFGAGEEATFLQRWHDVVGAEPDDGAAPPLLVVDDAQWCDERTASLLAGLAAGRRVQVVLARRVGEGLPAALLPLLREPTVLRIELGELEIDHVDMVARTVLHATVTSSSVRTLASASRGNPLLLRELITSARADGAFVRTRGALSLPDEGRSLPSAGPLGSGDVTAVIAERIRSLGPDERSVVDALAVGGPLPVAVFDDWVDPRVLAGLERAGLVVATAGAGAGEAAPIDVVELAHPLHIAAARRSLSPAAESEILRGLVDRAAALRHRPGAGAIDPLRVARWLLALGAGDEIDDVVAVARRANETNDLALAEAAGRHAWRRSHDVDAALVVAGALTRANRLADALALMAEIRPHARTPRELAALAGQELTVRSLVDEEPDRTTAWGEAELDRFDPVAEPVATIDLATSLAFVTMLAGRPVAAASILEQALELVDPRTEIPAALLFRSHYVAVMSAALRGAEVHDTKNVAVTTRLTEELSKRSPDARHATDVVAWDRGRRVGWSLGAIYQGRFEEGGGHAAELALESIAMHDDNFEGWGWFIAGYADFYAGRLRDAQRRWLDAWLAFAPRSMDSRMRIVREALLAIEQLAPDTVDPLVGQGWFDVLTPGMVWFLDADRARFRALPLLRREPDHAAEILRGAIPRARRGGMAIAEALTRYELTFCAPGDVANLDHLVAAAGSCAGTWVAACVDEATARHAAPGSPRHLEALAGLAAVGDRLHPYLILSGLHDEGIVPIGEVARAREGTDLPLPRPLAPGAAASVLTEREREVAMAAVGGDSNRDIAAALGISKRTVDATLAKVYRKLGISGRDGLLTVLG